MKKEANKMLNHIVIMGRLTRAPELKATQSGVSVVSFTLAVDRDYAAKGSDKETDFIDVTAWRNTAEFVSKYFDKGRMAVVSGRLQVRKWQDADGNTRRAAEIVADNVYFGDSKPTDAATKGNCQNAENQNAVAPTADELAIIADDDDELPF